MWRGDSRSARDRAIASSSETTSGLLVGWEVARTDGSQVDIPGGGTGLIAVTASPGW